MWLAYLDPWADSIASRLAPGGVFHIVDAHPFLTVFDDEAGAPPLRVRYPYFSREANYYRERGSYVDRAADFAADSYSWQHTFEEIVGVLARRGLVIGSLREYPVISWQAIDFMVPDTEGLWRLPPEAGDIPLMFSLSARKPEWAGLLHPAEQYGGDDRDVDDRAGDEPWMPQHDGDQERQHRAEHRGRSPELGPV